MWDIKEQKPKAKELLQNMWNITEQKQKAEELLQKYVGP
jgi:DNA-binding transcriptional regulator PaaX